ncbi:chemotaxis protein CheD [bacterium]|nr:chemotaxis protein CheD [bacterium]
MDQFIKIAEIGVLESPGTLKTVVGSCIALCIWDRYKKIGGMVHIMMPKKTGHTDSDGEGKYADTAVQALFARMSEMGCNREDLIASLIGGASLFGSRLSNGGRKPIGIENFEAVKKELGMFRLSIHREDIGGDTGRRVVFDCDTGEIEITNLSNSWQTAGNS